MNVAETRAGIVIESFSAGHFVYLNDSIFVTTLYRTSTSHYEICESFQGFFRARFLLLFETIAFFTEPESSLQTWFFKFLFLIATSFLIANSGAQAFTTFESIKREGVYMLQAGTDGCARELVWRQLPRCGGFQLTASRDGQAIDARKNENFCHINQGSGREVRRTDKDTHWTIRYQVIAEENIIRKAQHIERRIGRMKASTYTVELQASLILDRGGSFMFDRSLGGEGTSCLYKKLKPMQNRLVSGF